MKYAVSALWALSAALLVTDTVSAQSLLSIDLGGSSQAAATTTALASSAAPSSTPAASSVAPATTMPSSDASSSVASSSSVSSPAYAAGTVTYKPDPLPSSTAIINVNSLPSSVPPISSSASSNYTLPSATATGTYLSLPSLISSPYQVVFADTNGVPQYNWNLAMNSSSDMSKEATCASQMQFCKTAGCADPEAKLTNFCETKYMGVACSCSKGESRLQQYQWPVMLADCQGRNTACKDACIKPDQGVASTNDCVNKCLDQFGQTCGKPGQYAANYAVRKQGDKPTYSIVQGGTAGNAAFRSTAAAGVIAITASAATLLLLGL